MDDFVNCDMKNCDRLSELPDSLVFHIFSKMRIRDAVRTTTLSKRWKNLWTTIPYFNFDSRMMASADEVRNFVNGALKLWRGIGISRIMIFKIGFESQIDNSLYRDIDSWVHFAMENRVEQLHVDLRYPHNTIEPSFGAIQGAWREMYCAPQFLYSCSSLQGLILRGFNLEFNGNVQWHHLKRLCIDGFGVTQHAINQVLAGTPKLERFVLNLIENHENLSIQSSNLKRLSIAKYLYNDDDVPSVDTELRICTPKLEELLLSGVPYSKCLLMDVSSLNAAVLEFWGPNKYDLGMFKGNDFVGETMWQILTIQRVEEIVLTDWCIQAVGGMKKKMVSAFPNVKMLELSGGCFKEYKQILGVVEIFPKLEKLVVQLEINNGSALEFETKLHYSFLQQLRIVKLTWANREDSIFPFVEIVLKYASKLEKMVIRVRGTEPSKAHFLASQKFLGMPRSSPAAQFIFC